MGAEAGELGHRGAKGRPVWLLIWRGHGGETVSPQGVISKPLQFQRWKMLEVVWQQWVELGRESNHRGQRNSEEGMGKWLDWVGPGSTLDPARMTDVFSPLSPSPKKEGRSQQPLLSSPEEARPLEQTYHGPHTSLLLKISTRGGWS